MRTFEEFKAEILTRAKAASACTDQYKRAYAAHDFSELFAVIKDNFSWCCNNKVIDADMIVSVCEDAARCDVWCNVDVATGFALATGTATVWAYGSATVWATGTATVRATGTATVWAYGTATVRAYGTAYINVRSDMDCKISDKAIMRCRDTDEIMIVAGSLKIKEIEVTE